jgi:hypothetical protein
MWRDQEGLQAVDRMVWENRLITVDEIAEASMFGPMKETLRGGRFSSDEEVISTVQNWLRRNQKNFFPSELKKKLMKHWNRCVEVEGDYVQK